MLFFRHETATPGKKLSKEKILALFGVNTTGMHRLKPVAVGWAAKSRTLKDSMHELPITYYSSSSLWFTMEITEYCFFKYTRLS